MRSWGVGPWPWEEGAGGFQNNTFIFSFLSVPFRSFVFPERKSGCHTHAPTHQLRVHPPHNLPTGGDADVGLVDGRSGLVHQEGREGGGGLGLCLPCGAGRPSLAVAGCVLVFVFVFSLPSVCWLIVCRGDDWVARPTFDVKKPRSMASLIRGFVR